MNRHATRTAPTVAGATALTGLALALSQREWALAATNAVPLATSAATLLIANGGLRGLLALVLNGRQDAAPLADADQAEPVPYERKPTQPRRRNL